jgi:trehalose-6-phosphate synthase
LIIKQMNLPQEERAALLSFSHVLLNTSYREGLSLIPLEFAMVKSH